MVGKARPVVTAAAGVVEGVAVEGHQVPRQVDAHRCVQGTVNTPARPLSE